MDEFRDVTLKAYMNELHDIKLYNSYQLVPFKTWKLYPFNFKSFLPSSIYYEKNISFSDVSSKNRNICDLYAQVFIFGDTSGLTSSQISQLPFEVKK